MLFPLSLSRLLFCASVIALLVGIAEDPANSRPAKNVAAIKVITKDTFLSIDKLLRNDFGRFGSRGVGETNRTVELSSERVNEVGSREKELSGCPGRAEENSQG
jgi:hypothetical protein